MQVGSVSENRHTINFSSFGVITPYYLVKSIDFMEAKVPSLEGRIPS
jgi:hypothetical protein